MIIVGLLFSSQCDSRTVEAGERKIECKHMSRCSV